MNKLTLFITGVALIVLAFGGIMIYTLFKGDTYVEPPIREINFGDECNEDDDCSPSSVTCLDGNVNTCKNGCVYGVCTTCKPECEGEVRCGNITCSDSIRVCPDGRKVKCPNYCDIETGRCTTCNPACRTQKGEELRFGVNYGKYTLDAVPCTNSSYEFRTDKTSIKENLTRIRLPEGYSTIIDPFSVECNGFFEVTLNIPDKYADVQAMRCRGEDCNSVVTKHVTELKCGDKVSNEFLREETYLEPKFMPIEIKEVQRTIDIDKKISSDKYQVQFRNAGELKVTLSQPMYAVEEPKNPSLKIVGTPLIVNVEGNLGNEASATITMPYVEIEAFDEESAGMFIKSATGWKYVGGSINEDKTVTAEVENIGEYIENNRLLLALMEVVCLSCYGSSFTKVYEPKGGSKSAVVLLHGFAPRTNTFQKIIDDIRYTNQPWEVWTFDYPSSKPLNDTIKEFLFYIEKNHFDYNNIDFVAHSLGGLIIQDALHMSYVENQNAIRQRKDISYKYLDKVGKVILIATPNEGSPLTEVYNNLFQNLVNNQEQALFSPNTPVLKNLVEGKIIPRVPGVSYYVIAGVKSFTFNDVFFELPLSKVPEASEKNDGVITVKSAQNVGGEYIDNQCENYWELNLTHIELLDNPITRKIIGQIISERVSSGEDGLMGHNRYFELKLDDCSADDNLIIIGKEIKEEEIYDETGCSCGNGYCGEGEDEVSCPSDCGKVYFSEKAKNYTIFIAVLIVSILIFAQYKIYKRLNHPHVKMLIDHIKTYYEIVPSEGYTHEELSNAFVEKGWPKWIVKRTVGKLKKEFHNAYHLPLKKHLKEHLKKGYSPGELKNALMQAGWKQEDLDRVFRGEKLQPGFKLRRKYRAGMHSKFFKLKD